MNHARSSPALASATRIALTLVSTLALQAQEKTLDEVLSLSLADLANLPVLTALKGPGTANSVPATVRVITAEQIQENGYATLEEALADLPGFQFRNILGFNSYVFMRGVPQQNNKILVLVDGIQINEPNSGGFYGGGHYNLANVARIEVVYGPASALYGTNAIGGIVNILTRDPKDGQGGRASLRAGNHATRQADTRFAHFDPASTFGFSVSAMGKYTEKADLRGEKGDGNWTDAMENFERDLAADGQLRFHDFRAGWLVQDKDASRSTVNTWLPDQPGPAYRDHGTNWHIRFLHTWVDYAYTRAETWSLRSSLAYREATVLDDTTPIIESETSTSPGRQLRYFRPSRQLSHETQVNWMPKADWRLSAGFVLEQERLATGYAITASGAENEPAPEPGMPATNSNRLLSGYLQGQIPLTKDLHLFLGLRHDDSSYYGTVDTPRAGLVFNQDQLTAKLLFGRAFRAPKPWDYTDGVGNPRLKPEEFQSIEFTGNWAFSDHLRLDLALYRNSLDNLLTRVTVGGTRWINAGVLDTRGGELGLEFRKGGLKAFANYTYTASEDQNGLQVAEIARHGANAGGQWNLTPALKAGLRAQYFGARTNPKTIPKTGSDRLDPALVLHASIAWKLPHGFELQGFVNNLLDATFYHPSNLPPSRFRQPQRQFLLQFSRSF